VSAAIVAWFALVAVGNARPETATLAKVRQNDATPLQSKRQITFNRDIAPILYRSCAQCHRPGEAAPFPLLTYTDAKSHARQIAAVTRSRFMPPWLPSPGELKFADELRLPDDEIARIQEWVEQGAMEGTPADVPAQPKFAEGWQLGKPDVVAKAIKAYTLPPSGTDNYWNFVFRTPVDRTRWLKAIEIRPGDKRLVHHANVLVDREQTARHQEKEPGAGFTGMELTIESEVFDPDSHFLFWKPGSAPYVEPDGMALRLDKNTDLILNAHLQPSGKLESIQPTLGLYFTDKPATVHPILLQIENDRMLDIPAGAKDFLVTDNFTLPVDVDVLAIYPHAHYLGKDLQASAALPDGTSKTLIHIPDWNLNWQAVFRYAQPVRLPKGTTISMKFRYDNSENNLRNPNDPPQRVVAGNRAVDEMAHLWLQVVPQPPSQSTGDPRVLIQEAMARHNLQKNPDDFEAHYNLGALLMGRGELPEAIRQFSEANRIRPNEAPLNNAFGAALLAAGQPEEAIPHLTAALNARPDYFDAHYNLGNALASLSDFKGALAEFQTAVRLNPEDANAEANLGSAFAETGNTKEARLHFQRALHLDPKNELARDNLQNLNQAPPARPR
jgi:Tfp pilus assembly protein PilF/mono/diheme cytochrome c family protein